MVCDDDHIYPSEWLETLIRHHLSNPEWAIGFRGTLRLTTIKSFGIMSQPSFFRILEDFNSFAEGWRVSTDGHWPGGPTIQGWDILKPYRVGVITANEGKWNYINLLIMPTTFISI